MNEHSIRRVVIVGGGTAGWMAAAAFARFLNNGYTQVTLVESDEIGTVGVGEATIPPIINFNQMLGLDENAFLAATAGTFKLGIEFVNWGAIGERYFHPFGTYGHDLQGIHFHQLWLRENARRPIEDIAAWSMSAMAAQHGTFGRPNEDARSPVRELFYAFHFDASLYARYLRDYSEKAGIVRIEGKINEVVQRATDAIVAWLGVLLARQKKLDFRPKDDSVALDRANTEPCLACSAFLQRVRDVAFATLTGRNREVFLSEVGVTFHGLLLEHLRKFQVSAAGGLMLTKCVPLH